ncbi:cytochrome P450 [Streptomyces tendae]|uniref:cytochrome P450 n=1 Tax=Streptomyces tendae TaxID=1932 RepID=UPI001676F84C|nr:cytochrome P450 [Streptomyces tendae]
MPAGQRGAQQGMPHRVLGAVPGEAEPGQPLVLGGREQREARPDRGVAVRGGHARSTHGPRACPAGALALPLDRTETIATALLLFGAGNTPTANLIGNGLDALFRFPESRRRLTEDPGLLPAAVDEMLRFDSPSQFDVFTVLEPHSFAGTDLKPGQGVMMMLGVANHDPERFDDPDAFDVARKENGHLSFAAGIHHCLGAHLARLQAEVVFGRLLARFPKVEPAAQAVRHPGLGNRGFDSIPVNLAA